MTPKMAAMGKTVQLPPDMALGFVSASSVAVYPPGVPCLLPGQQITREAVDYLASAYKYGFDVFGLNNGMIRVADR
jgi:arginine/lysine/ornithine decarboxylase